MNHRKFISGASARPSAPPASVPAAVADLLVYDPPHRAEAADQSCSAKPGLAPASRHGHRAVGSWRLFQSDPGWKPHPTSCVPATIGGLTLFDTADSYGSHPEVGEAISKLPRDKVVIISQVPTTAIQRNNGQSRY